MKNIIAAISLLLLVRNVAAESVFIEAERFTSSNGAWSVSNNEQTRAASRLETLHGASGDPEGVASKPITIEQPGSYRVWIRYLHHIYHRGAFRLAIDHDGKTVAAKTFDTHPVAEAKSWTYVWDYVDAELPAATFNFELSKFELKNCWGYVRHIDCILITKDKTLVPSHLTYGPQTYLRVTLDDVYDDPVQIHIFADHYRAPWYQHVHLSKAGANPGWQPDYRDRLLGGEQTPWCNITPFVYQDSGAILNFTIRHDYPHLASRFCAKLEFATAADEQSIVRTMEVRSESNGLVVVVPPDLTTAEHRSWLKRDSEFAEDTGRIADGFDWPEIGKKPRRFPFFVNVRVGGYDTLVDQAIVDREWKTLNYFGFANRDKILTGGVWFMQGGSYCQPDVERMKQQAAADATRFGDGGKSKHDIVFCMLMDEPNGQPSTFAAQDEAYHEAFRAWLKKLSKSPSDLLVSSWDAVKPVPESQRDDFPALHYFTQRFRTRALADFIVTQRHILEEAYGRSLPTLVNFSDGAVYYANFYEQGVDYFELLDAEDQNAIWGEDWCNYSSSYQCGAYNVDLMRAAARERKQLIGHYLIAHAGRKPWDIKLKAASETARGVRVWENFSYGVSWGNHEGGPAWKSHTWYSKPETWRANAEIVREIGGAEDLLLSALADPAEVAILYSSSTDAWTVKRNCAFGFNRMHTWMALTHAQIPVDFVAERQVARGGLGNYKVCYLSGPNLTRAAAQKLREWVSAGGVLYLSAGAASLDEFNRPLEVLDSLLPNERGPVETLQPYLNSGSYIYTLQAKDHVVANNATFEVLSVRQRQTPRKNSEVLATFDDGSAAIIRSKVGRGRIYSAGFLPALDYIKQAVVARRELAAAQASVEAFSANQTKTTPPTDIRLERSYNPWEFSAEARELILQPVRAAGVNPPLTCSVPLVDAVLLQATNGAVIPVANYTLNPLEKVELSLRSQLQIARIETIHQGDINFETAESGVVKFSIPLDASDYIKVYYK